MRVLNTSTTKGYFGTDNPCTILVTETRVGAWYCVEGSTNINLTAADNLVDGVNVEGIVDYDTMQAYAPVNDLDDLIRELEER